MTDTLAELIDETLAFIRHAPGARARLAVSVARYRLLAENRPPTVDRYAALTGIPAAEITTLLTDVLGRRVGDDGSVSEPTATLAELPRYRVRMLDTGHETELCGCAVDALLLSAVTSRPARIEATCPVTGQPASIRVGTDRIEEAYPADAVVSLVVPACDPSELISSVCRYGQIFASTNAADTWRAEHPQAALLSPAHALRYAAALVDELTPGTRLFSYGTLRDPAVQLATFGRHLPGSDDTLPGYRINVLDITDTTVLDTSGLGQHPIATATGNRIDAVHGTVLRLTADELAAADSYEVDAYQRLPVVLGSGTCAWAYVARS